MSRVPKGWLPALCSEGQTCLVESPNQASRGRELLDFLPEALDNTLGGKCARLENDLIKVYECLLEYLTLKSRKS